jgi:predicted branched-subunit amino acid permease
MGLAAAASFKGGALARFCQGQFVLDESWAVAMKPDGGVDVARLVGAGCLLYAGWVAGTVFGALGAGWLPGPQQLGLDAAFPALFLALLGPRLGAPRAVAAASAAGALCLGLIPLLPVGLPVLAAGAACLIGWARRG